tara:strand:+ start:7772 stop:7936 length:165 start_codon:yes stop_codon:yes gene_type:complete
MEFLLGNGAEILLALMVFLKVIVNITPTEKDNKMFAYIDDLVNYFCKDRKSGDA